METNNDDLKHIRSMMERSSKFLSISGISGVMAGVIALLGAGIVYMIVHAKWSFTGYQLFDVVLIAVLVLALAGGMGFYFSIRKARKSKLPFISPATKQIIKDFGVAMIVGGVFCIILVYQHTTHLVASAMLIFYGLALIAAGARTYRDVKMLGICEIALGVLAGLFPHEGLIFWAVGFGLLHIIYGTVMHYKYDAVKPKKD